MGVFCFAQNKASDIKWIKSNLGGFQINIEPHTRGMMSPNLAMQFNGVFQMLRQNVEWMIPGKVNVEVYQDKKSFLINFCLHLHSAWQPLQQAQKTSMP